MAKVMVGGFIVIAILLLVVYVWARIDLARNVSHIHPPTGRSRRRAF